MSTNITVRGLLSRGDEICIEFGRLVIHPASGKTVPPTWHQEHSPDLIREILTTLGIEAYEYCSYTTGHYGNGKLPGLTLQFQSVVAHESAYAIFNVDLTRSRSTKAGKKGAPLPEGHFRTGKRSHFYCLWKSTRLPEPKRLAALHDYMGNLQGILFTADKTAGHQNRMNAGSLQPLSVSTLDVRRAFLPDNQRTMPGQMPDNIRTKVPDKDHAQSLAAPASQPKATTCHKNHGKTVTSERVSNGTESPIPSRKRPEEQTNEEWLADHALASSNDYRQITRRQ